jgi:4-hydroxy-3-methylbut-2-enyl diphosphate reductase
VGLTAGASAPEVMVDNAGELREEWFADAGRVGLTAGASAPEVLVDEVIQRLRQLGALSVRKMDGIEETVKFPLPKGLKIDAATGLEISVGKQPETGG